MNGEPRRGSVERILPFSKPNLERLDSVIASKDNNSFIWGLRQLNKHFSRASSEIVSACYNALIERSGYCGREACILISLIIDQEVREGLLPPVVKVKNLMQLFMKYYRVDPSFAWKEHILLFCSSLIGRNEVDMVFSAVYELIYDTTLYSSAIASLFINGMTEAGHEMPQQLINDLLQTTNLVRQCVFPIIYSITRIKCSLTASKCMDTALSLRLSKYEVVDALLRLPTIPDPCLDYIYEFFHNTNVFSETILLTSKHYKRLLSLKVLQKKELIKTVLQSPLFLPNMYEYSFQFFNTAICDLGESSKEYFMRNVLDSGSPHRNKCLLVYLKNTRSPNAYNVVVSHMCRDSTFREREEWINTFKSVLVLLPKEYCDRLVEFLVDMLQTDVSYGQSVVLQPHLPPVQIHRWRDVYIMIEAFHLCGEYLQNNSHARGVIIKAVCNHPQVMWKAAVNIVKCCKQFEAELLSSLLQGSSHHRIAFVKIIAAIFDTTSIRKYGGELVNLAKTNVGSTVSCCALRTLALFARLSSNYHRMLVFIDGGLLIRELRKCKLPQVMDVYETCRNEFEKIEMIVSLNLGRDSENTQSNSPTESKELCRSQRLSALKNVQNRAKLGNCKITNKPITSLKKSIKPQASLVDQVIFLDSIKMRK